MQQATERLETISQRAQSAYRTLLVHAEPAMASSHRVELAASLARQFDARLIGVGAGIYEPVTAGEPFASMVATAEWMTLLQAQVEKDIDAAQASFRRDAAGADLGWRAIHDYPAKALRDTARAADLIVLGASSSAPDSSHADPAEVVMTAGRPVLVVPPGRSHLRARSVLVAWKDTRECRRAIVDAMPFLQLADEVIVHAVTSKGEEAAVARELDDVVDHLRRRGVLADKDITPARNADVAAELERVAGLHGADLIVAGAYGRSRMREWIFGGATESFLLRPACCVLMSH
jgi:nucleotide-binding universal stress UspA family protein